METEPSRGQVKSDHQGGGLIQGRRPWSSKNQKRHQGVLSPPRADSSERKRDLTGEQPRESVI